MNRIREAREKIGMSQSKLARNIGVTPQSISLYEQGKREPKLATWEKLAKQLGVTVAYLQGFGETDIALLGLTEADVVGELPDGVDAESATTRQLWLAMSNAANKKDISLRRQHYEDGDIRLTAIDDAYAMLNKIQNMWISVSDTEKNRRDYKDVVEGLEKFVRSLTQGR